MNDTTYWFRSARTVLMYNMLAKQERRLGGEWSKAYDVMLSAPRDADCGLDRAARKRANALWDKQWRVLDKMRALFNTEVPGFISYNSLPNRLELLRSILD